MADRHADRDRDLREKYTQTEIESIREKTSGENGKRQVEGYISIKRARKRQRERQRETEKEIERQRQRGRKRQIL